jgi:hypothetical protein
VLRLRRLVPSHLRRNTSQALGRVLDRRTLDDLRPVSSVRSRTLVALSHRFRFRLDPARRLSAEFRPTRKPDRT